MTELIGSFSDAVDTHIYRTGGRTDLGEMSKWAHEYEFRFEQRNNAVPIQQYLRFGDGHCGVREIEQVLLFSGGLDSLGGAIQESVLEQGQVALVSHRSNPRISNRQARVVQELHALCKQSPLHVPVWVQQRGSAAGEYTNEVGRSCMPLSRSRWLAFFGLDRMRFYENGIVSVNLPISEQATGGRATKTTHPKVLTGFAKLFSCLIQETFAVENPFVWRTGAELVGLIGFERPSVITEKRNRAITDCDIASAACGTRIL